MSQTPTPTRLNSGPPWWITALVALTTVGIVAGLVLTSLAPDPEVLYGKALAAVMSGQDDQESRVRAIENIEGYDQHGVYLRALQAFSAHRDGKASGLFHQIPDGHKLKVSALQLEGTCLQRLGKFAEGFECLEGAASLADDGDLQPRMALAKAYDIVGSLKKADEVASSILEDEPDHTEARLIRSGVRAAGLEFEKALDDFRILLNTEEDFMAASPSNLMNYANCLLEFGDKERLQDLSENYASLLLDKTITVHIEVASGSTAGVGAILRELENLAPDPGNLSTLKMILATAEEKWEVASTEAVQASRLLPRNRLVLEAAAKAFEGANEPEKLKPIQENLKVLSEMKESLKQKIESIGGDVSDGKIRLEIAKLHTEVGMYRQSARWYLVAGRIDASLEEESQAGIEYRNVSRGPLVPLWSEEKNSNKEEPAKEELAKEAPAKEEPAKEEPAKQKNDTAEEVKEKVKADDDDEAKAVEVKNPDTKPEETEKKEDDDTPESTEAADKTAVEPESE